MDHKVHLVDYNNLVEIIMKREVIRILKQESTVNIFSEDRYNLVKSYMKWAMSMDPILKEFLQLDDLNKAKWIADHMRVAYHLKIGFNKGNNQSEQ